VSSERSTPTAAAALIVAALATIALGTRSPPPQHRVEEVDAPTRRAVDPAVPIDMNSATEEEIESLPRVGPALAARIVAYREAHGPFRAIADLDPVSGVGPALLASLATRVRFGTSRQNLSNNQPTRAPTPIESRPGATSVRNP